MKRERATTLTPRGYERAIEAVNSALDVFRQMSDQIQTSTPKAARQIIERNIEGLQFAKLGLLDGKDHCEAICAAIAGDLEALAARGE
jgi:rhamnose utilization protein RhaD (predicted bifunctional aldolase and dehydrogenase)